MNLVVLCHDQATAGFFVETMDDAGAFLRFSVTYLATDEAAEDALMAETVRRLRSVELRF